MVARKKDEGKRWGIWDGHIHTAIFKMDNQLYSTGNSAQYYVAAWMRGGLGGNGYMYVYGWVPSLFIWNYQSIDKQLYPQYKKIEFKK